MTATVTVVLQADERKSIALKLPDINQPLHRLLQDALNGLIGDQALIGVYFLKHQRRLLTDLSLPYRLSGLPPAGVSLHLIHRSELTLVELKQVSSATSKTNGGVVVALQTTTAGRLQANFRPETSLWQLLLDFQTLSHQ